VLLLFVALLLLEMEEGDLLVRLAMAMLRLSYGRRLVVVSCLSLRQKQKARMALGGDKRRL
jgi:hypothetical protein